MEYLSINLYEIYYYRLHEDESKTFKVKLRADWKTEFPYFDFDTMIPPWTMARAFAKETWSREYFNSLKE